MSEYQFIAFRAIDGPVSGKNLEYMRRQSSRAEVTPWSFENEYHFGDFGGNALEMLRRGYDLHLHYANYGIRKLLIRLPHGLPDARAFKPYAVKGSLEFLKDKQGPGGCLSISPYFEAGLLEELWEVGTLLDKLIPLRAELLSGDLRPLYLAHLAVLCDSEQDPDEVVEAPVPAGLGKLSEAQSALAEFYGLSGALIAAAALDSPPLPATVGGSEGNYEQWLRDQPEKAKNEWLASLMNDSTSAVRAAMLAKYRNDVAVPTWATTEARRTIAELQAKAAEIPAKSWQGTVAKATRKRKRE